MAFAVTYDFSPNTVISSTNMNTNFADLETAINAIATYITTGQITNVMLAQITTASKVSGAALTLLANIPSAAGQIPVANLGTGTPSSSNFLRGDGAWTAVPAISYQKKSGLLNIPAGTTGNQSVTGVGFTPQKITFYAVANGVGGSRSSQGVAFSVTDRGMVCASDSSSYSGGSASLVYKVASATAVKQGDIVSFDADGFTIGATNIGVSLDTDIIWICERWS